MPLSSRAGVSVYTWGSEMLTPGESGFDGMKHFYEVQIEGGNVGHAAMLLTLPNTKENRELVNKYLEDSNIPVTYRTYKVPKATFSRSTRKNPKPKPIISSESAYKEKVIEIYFSWFPAASKSQAGYFQTEQQDGIEERIGVDVPYNATWEERLKPETRKKSGNVNAYMRLGIRSTVHPIGLPSQEHKECVLIKHQLELLENRKESLALLKSKLDDLEKKISETNEIIPLPLTEQLLIKRLFTEEELKHIGIDLKKESSISVLSFRGLIDRVKAKTEESNKETTVMIYKFLKSALPLISKRELKEASGGNEALDLCNSISSIENLLIIVNNSLDTSSPENNIPLLKEKLEQALEFFDEESDTCALLSYYLDNMDDADNFKKNVNDLQGELETKLDVLFSDLDDFYNEHVGSMYLSDSLFQRSFMYESTTTGEPPDHVVELPIETDSAPGLNVEAMLKQMQTYHQEGVKKFNLINYNCSATTTEVLAAGAGEYKPIFEKKAFMNSILTPQMVYNNARMYGMVLQDPSLFVPHSERSYLQKLEEAASNRAIEGSANQGLYRLKNPIKYIKRQPKQYISSMLDIVGSGAVAIGASTIRGLPGTLYQAATGGMMSVAKGVTSMFALDSFEQSEAKKQRGVQAKTDDHISNPLQLNDAEFAELTRNPGMFPGASMLLSGQLRKGEKLARKVPEVSDDRDPDHSPKKQRTKK